ncbi:HesA/MoeB/ThiF family protein [Myxococcota bacterium]|nr:HesA/MoeB/ThiF family protein [Myxococcota bacterium]
MSRPPSLSEDQVLRYSRQIILPGFGARGQAALGSAQIGVRGEGVAARVASLYLAAAGVGRLVLDRERGDLDGDPDHPLSTAFLAELNPDVGARVDRVGEGADPVIDLREEHGFAAPPAPLRPARAALVGALAATEALCRLAWGRGGEPGTLVPALDWGLPPLPSLPTLPPPEAATVVVLGAGGLGCPAALALALAGVGRIVLVDSDVVDLSNLQRQVLYLPRDVGRPKVECAAERLSRVAGARVVPVRARLDRGNAAELLAGADLVIEGSDSLETKFLVNDACVRAGVPVAIAGVIRTEAQAIAIVPGAGACYRCVFHAPPPGGGIEAVCAREGVLGAVAGVAGAAQAQEAIKLLLGWGRPLASAMWLFSGRDRFQRVVAASRRPGCPACGGETRV